MLFHCLHCDIYMKKEKWVVFREEAKLVHLIDSVVDLRGIDRSDFIREAIRKRLAELGFFPELTNILAGLPQTHENKPNVLALK